MSNDFFRFQVNGFPQPLSLNAESRTCPFTFLYEILGGPNEFAGFRTLEYIPESLSKVHGIKGLLEAYAGEQIRLVSSVAGYALLHPTTMEETRPLRLVLTNEPA